MPANFNQSIIAVFSSAAAGDDDFTMLRPAIIADALARADGIAAGTCTINKGAVAVSNAMNVNAGTSTLARAATLNSGSYAVGDILRIVKSAASATVVNIYLSAPGVVQ